MTIRYSASSLTFTDGKGKTFTLDKDNIADVKKYILYIRALRCKE